LHEQLARVIDAASLWHGVLMFGALAVLGFIWELPGSLYYTFVLEERFGFNKTTVATLITDTVKSALITTLIGAPLLWLVLWLMRSMGGNWWLWTWAVLIGFNLAAMVIYPIFIAPLFNKFEPLKDEALATPHQCPARPLRLQVQGPVRDGWLQAQRPRQRLLHRLWRCQAHRVLRHPARHPQPGRSRSRAGPRTRPLQAQAPVATRRRLRGNLAGISGQSGLAQPTGCLLCRSGVSAHSEALALILFSAVLPAVTFPFTPLMSFWSRKHEFEADNYAKTHAQAADLVSALVKLYRDNAATLTPDPIHSLFYDSHPPAAIRISRLRAA
jgi:STE24 endopeptidase